MIPNRPSPRLRTAGKWSQVYADFVACCLEKDPEKRPSAQELLQVGSLRAFTSQHRFVKDAAIELQASKKAPEAMRRLVDRLLARRADLAKKKRKSNQGTNKVLFWECQKSDRFRGYRRVAERGACGVRGGIQHHDREVRFFVCRHARSEPSGYVAPSNEGTVREVHYPPARNPYRMNPSTPIQPIRPVAPISAPVSAPISAPVSAPISAPVSAPVWMDSEVNVQRGTPRLSGGNASTRLGVSRRRGGEWRGG